MARKLSIELDLDSRGFTAKIKDAAGGVRTFNTATERTAKSVQRMERRMHGLLATSRDLTLVLSQVRTAIYNVRQVMTGWIESIVRTNIQMERMTYLLANMSDAASSTERFKEAAANMRFLFDTAKSAPFSINALTDSFVKMKSVGIDPTKGSLHALTNAVAAFGGSSDVLHRASIAIQQMGGKGVISMEELRQQLGEAVPNAVSLLARSLDLTYGDLVDKISKGQVEASSALQKMFNEFERTFGGSASALMQSFGGRLSILQTMLVEFANTVGGLSDQGGFTEGGFMYVLSEQVSRLIDIMDSPEANAFAVKLGEALTKIANGAVKAVEQLWRFRDIILTAGKYIAIYFASTAVISTVGNLFTAFSGGFSALATSARTATSSLELMNIAWSLNRQGAATAREATVAMAQGLRGLGTSFAAALGPISLFVTAAFFAADAMGLFKDKTADAKRAIDDFNNSLYTKDGLEALTDRAEALDKKLADLKGRLEKNYADLAKPLWQNPFPDSTRTAIGVLERQIAETIEEREKLREYIQRGTKELFEQSAEADARQVQRSIDKMVGAVKTRYNLAQKELDEERKKIANDENLSQEERAQLLENNRLARINANRRAYEDELKVYQDYANQLLKMQDQLLEDGSLKNYSQEFFGNSKTVEEAVNRISAAYEALQSKIAELGARNAEFAANDIAMPNFLSGNANTEGTDSLATRVATLQARSAQLKAELNGASGALAKFNEQVRIGLANGDYDKTAAGFEAMVAAGKKAAQEIDDFTTDLKNKRADETIIGRLETEFSKAANASAAWSKVLTGDMSEAEAETSRFNSRIDSIVNSMSEATPQAAMLGEEIKQAFLESRGLEFAVGLNQATEQLRANLLKGRELKEAEYQLDIQRIDQYIDLERYSGEERKRIEAAVNDYKEARFNQYLEESKTGFQRMMDEWLRTTDAMDTAAQGWMNDFVDGLVEGQLKFSDFAESILKDIAKIIIRAQVAAAAIALINAFTGGSAEAPAPSGTFNGISPGALGQLHTGGIVGEKVGATHSGASMALLAMAKRYHSGGYPGLGPNEVPAILEKGEKVQTVAEQRMAALGGGNNVQVNIFNQSGQNVQEESREGRFDGEQFILDIVIGAAGKPGGMRTAIQEAANNG